MEKRDFAVFRHPSRPDIREVCAVNGFDTSAELREAVVRKLRTSFGIEAKAEELQVAMVYAENARDALLEVAFKEDGGDGYSGFDLNAVFGI